MNAKLMQEIERITKDLAPPANSIGMLTSAEMSYLIAVAARRGAIAGWVQGMRTAAISAKRQNDILSDELKDLQAQLDVSERIR